MAVAHLLLRVDVLEGATAPDAKLAVRDEEIEAEIRGARVAKDKGGGVVRPLLLDVERVALGLLYGLCAHTDESEAQARGLRVRQCVYAARREGLKRVCVCGVCVCGVCV